MHISVKVSVSMPGSAQLPGHIGAVQPHGLDLRDQLLVVGPRKLVGVRIEIRLSGHDLAPDEVADRLHDQPLLVGKL